MLNDKTVQDKLFVSLSKFLPHLDQLRKLKSVSNLVNQQRKKIKDLAQGLITLQEIKY